MKIDDTEEDADVSGKRYLELGGHTLTLTVEKAHCTTKTFTKKVYVQGLLTDPTISYTGTQDGNASDSWPIYRFSYLTNDKMPFTVTAGNAGNTVKVEIDGVEKTSDNWKLFCGQQIQNYG